MQSGSVRPHVRVSTCERVCGASVSARGLACVCEVEVNAAAAEGTNDSTKPTLSSNWTKQNPRCFWDAASSGILMSVSSPKGKNAARTIPSFTLSSSPPAPRVTCHHALAIALQAAQPGAAVSSNEVVGFREGAREGTRGGPTNV